jgi:DNA-binding response OmpR family regulator
VAADCDIIAPAVGLGGATLPTQSTLNVLVIDDEEAHASLVARVIVKNGHRVDVAHRAEDGLAKFRDRDYDLVITDVFMSGMGGIEGIRKMREIQADISIIAMSAGFSDMSAEAALEAAREVGADAILPKPFPLADLRVTMTRLMEIRGAEK